MALVPQEIFEQVELSTRQVEQPLAADSAAGYEIQFQIRRFQSKHVRWSAASQQRANPGEQLGKRERLDQIVVGSEIQAANSIVNAVSRRQDQDWRLDVTLPKRLEDFEPTASRQHQIEDHEIEELGIRSIEPVLSRRSDDDVVMLSLER
jgi:hypothetical protein